MKDRRGQAPESPSSLLRALSGRDANAQLPMVARTRRAIRLADQERRARGRLRRRSVGVALFALGALLLLAGPMLWSSMEDLSGGEHFADPPMQVTLLLAWLMVSVVAALVAGWRRGGGPRDSGLRRR